MDRLPEHVLTEAFALANARGADLLVNLGHYDVWRGDLASMRGDRPRHGTPSVEQPAAVSLDPLLIARAIETLTPHCRAVLAARYGEKPQAPPAEVELVTDCERRLLEIYQSFEREHAATSNGRRR